MGNSFFVFRLKIPGKKVKYCEKFGICESNLWYETVLKVLITLTLFKTEGGVVKKKERRHDLVSLISKVDADF